MAVFAIQTARHCSRTEALTCNGWCSQRCFDLRKRKQHSANENTSNFALPQPPAKLTCSWVSPSLLQSRHVPLEQACSTPVSFRIFAVLLVFRETGGCGKNALLPRPCRGSTVARCCQDRFPSPRFLVTLNQGEEGGSKLAK